MTIFFLIIGVVALWQRDIDDVLSSFALVTFSAFLSAGQPRTGLWSHLVWIGCILVAVELVGNFAGWF